jgi:hypothetical protein
MTALESLTRLVQPPTKPEAAPLDYDWETLEEAGKLADSYKQFVRTYGAGILCDGIHILSPSAKTTYNIHIATDGFRGVNLSLTRTGAAISELVQNDQLFPVKKLGAFVVADSESGHTVLYLRTDDPRRENVVFYDHHAEVDGVTTQFNLSVVEFFEGVCSGKIKAAGFSELFLKRGFRPMKTSWIELPGSED